MFVVRTALFYHRLLQCKMSFSMKVQYTVVYVLYEYG